MSFPKATPRAVTEACIHLSRVDRHFGFAINRIGPVRFTPPTSDHFSYLVRAIIFQQLAGRVAATIHGRLIALLGGEVTPGRLLDKRAEDLRAAGVSANKFLALHDLAERSHCGALTLDDHKLAKLEDAAIIDELCEVRGIGPWTAQMFLMSQLRRLDVWPTGDLGVRRGYGLIHASSELSPKELEQAGELLRPYRSVAAVYCWRAIDFARNE
ncbi:MAG TPA: hypothetical protein VMU99_11270 [Acidimicrobiales bacterium]|nr:hypothetical protein [Acidimicrobiales bacterium]